MPHLVAVMDEVEKRAVEKIMFDAWESETNAFGEHVDKMFDFIEEMLEDVNNFNK